MNTTNPKVNPNEAAMPFAIPHIEADYAPGLTKREYFAGLALQGILCRDNFGVEYAAEKAVEMADALIKQLNTTNNGE